MELDDLTSDFDSLYEDLNLPASGLNLSDEYYYEYYDYDNATAAEDLSSFLGSTNDSLEDFDLNSFIKELNNDVQGKQDKGTFRDITLIACFVSVIFIGVMGNILVILAVLINSSMRTARNYFIGTLAASDLLLCVVTMPLTLWDVLR